MTNTLLKFGLVVCCFLFAGWMGKMMHQVRRRSLP